MSGQVTTKDLDRLVRNVNSWGKNTTNTPAPKKKRKGYGAMLVKLNRYY